jgi:predicted nucleic acid-binding protein
MEYKCYHVTDYTPSARRRAARPLVACLRHPIRAADYHAVGSPWTQADMFIAAIAAVHGLVLVTRNARDFEGCNLALLDPFQ